jgi:F-type H+-transporting ATPase subunit delta
MRKIIPICWRNIKINCNSGKKMAEISTIARPYALAAFDVAKVEAEFPAWSVFLNDAASVALQSDVRALSGNPRVSQEQVLSIFESAVGKMSASMRNFLVAVVSQGRADALPEISAAFNLHRNKFEGAADAVITAAFPMSDSELSALTAALEKKLSVKLKPVVVVDASLIGGFCAKVGDEVLDMSVRAKLERMKVALTA